MSTPPLNVSSRSEGAGAHWRTATIVLTIALVGAIAVMFHQQDQRRDAERAAATIRSGADFVAAMFEGNLPGVPLPERTPLSTLVDRASLRLEHAPPRDPLAAAAAAIALARIEFAIDRRKQAQERINATGAALDAIGAPALRLRFDAALLSLRIRAARASDADAEQGARELVAEIRRQLGKSDPLQFDALNLLGDILLAQKRYDDAVAEFDRVHAAAARVDQHAEALAGIAHAQAGTGKLPLAALTLGYRKTLLESEYGANDPRTLGAMGEYAQALQQNREFDAALENHDRVYAARSRLLGAAHPDALVALFDRAGVLWMADRPAEAEMSVREVLDRIDHDDHANANMITAANDLLAHALQQQQRYVDAVPVQREVIARTLAARQKVTFGEYSMLADLLVETGDFAGAEVEYQLALDAAFDELGPDDVNVHLLGNSYGDVLRRLGRHAQAETMLLKTEAEIRKQLDARHPLALKARQRLAELYDAMGAPERAAPWHAPAN